MGITNAQVFFQLQSLRSAKADLYEWLFKALVASVVIGFLSILGLSLYYLDEHVMRIGEARQVPIERAQVVFALVQLVLGMVMRYAEVEFGPPVAGTP
jgi:hypothetical protein